MVENPVWTKELTGAGIEILRELVEGGDAGETERHDDQLRYVPGRATVEPRVRRIVHLKPTTGERGD